MADRSLGADLAIRAAGAGLILIGVLAGEALFRRTATAPVEDPTALLWAVLAFVGVVPGLLLACLGRHIHDPVPLSDRWRLYAQRERAARHARRR